ncbi:IPTL-CTERM sorting domain-containing protein [Ramlibacter sp. H39-3-26]|uniref:IPTL-CTERM sorting domain-containing protein n=1 Tax=Curvibacter soli TaxID=3031331 RepID=UPI0023D9FE40|nr:IPTL-CTERM sorting domain-containing protein [Ramlibacter sp. H39-3-26]MDF1485596.1 IPTL-CTERM sorting domain-containing protein [Ramlibacter sp. H39-3-26]
MATVTINEKFTPATIPQGDSSTYTIEIYNDAYVALTLANATALLGPSISVTTPVVLTNTCGGSVTAAPGANSAVVLTGGSIPAAVGATPGSCKIDVQVTSTVSGNHDVVIPANTDPDAATAGFQALQAGVSVSNDTSATVTLLVTALAAPTGSKSFTPASSYVDVPTTLKITLANPNGTATMPLTSFIDTLPTNMAVAPTPNASVTCSGTGFVNGAVAANAGDTVVTLTGGTIGQSGTCVVSVDVVASATGTLTNSLAAGAIGNTRGLSSPAFSQSLPVSAPVALAKSFSPAVIPVGQPSQMTIKVTNNGAVPLNNTAFTDTLPANTQVATPPNGSVTCTAGGTAGTFTPAANDTAVSLSGATVPAGGGSCTLTVDVTATAEGVFTNTIPADAVSYNSVSGSPATSANLTAYAQLQVAKSVAPSQIAPGQWAEFTVSIYNYSGSDVTGASLTDSLPSVSGHQMVLDYSASPTGCSFTFTPSGTQNADGMAVLYGTGGTIPAATGTTPGSCQVKFRARAPAGAPVNTTFTNSLPIHTAVTGVGGSNTNSVSRNVAVVDAVVLGKSFAPASIYQGQTSTLTLTVANRYVNNLTAVAITDNLPAGLVLAADPAATNTCGGSLQAYPGDNQVTLTGASVTARPGNAVDTSCTITVQVTGTALGTHTNTIAPGDFSTSGGTIPAAVSANLAITAGLSATKSFSPAAVAPGGTARVTVHVTNQTPGALSNVSVNDPLSGGLAVANPANAASSCGGSPVVTANPGAASARLDGAALAPQASCDFSFDVTTTSGAGPWNNTIPAGNITSAQGPYNSAAVAANLGTQTASLALNKSFNPVIVTGNQPSLLTIDVVNSSGVPISGASFTDVFPAGIVVYSVPGAQTTCPGGTVAAAPGGTQVSLTGATLAAGATCQVKVTVTSIAFLNLTNTIPAGSVKSQGGYTNAGATSATLSTLQGLGVSKGFEPAYVAPNQTSRLKIRLVNTFNPSIVSPTILTGVTYTDALPAGLVFATPANPTTTCTGATVNVNTVAQAVTLTGVTLVPGNSCDLEVDVTTSALGQYLNSLPAHSVTTDQGITNEEPGESTLHAVLAPTVAKSFSLTTVTAGQTTQLIVTVSNPDAAVALTGVTLPDNLPPGLAVANPANTSTTCTGGVVAALPGAAKVTLNGATVPAGGNCEFRVAVVASEPGAFTNTIGAGAIQSDQGLTNGNPADATLTVLTAPTVQKAFAPAQIASGGISTLTITLGNANTTPVTLTAALVDALPGQVVVAGTPNVGGTCTAASVTATAGAIEVRYASGAAIPAGGCTITVDVTSSTMRAYTNTIAAGQLKTSAGTNPEPAVATLGVGQPAAPTVVKSFSPTTIDKGGLSTLTILLGNPNATALTLASAMTDTLPTGVVVATPAVIGGSCPSASVTATAGSGSVVYAAGATIPVSGCTITVQVTSATAGSYTNNIDAGALITNEAGANPVPAQAGLVVKTSVDPTVQKAFAPSTINPGGVSRLTITLGNGNASAATLTADLVDTLPANVLVATPPAVAGTCPSASVVAAAGGTSVAYKSGAAIPPGGCTIEVNVTSSVSGGPYTNTIAAGDLKTSLGTNGAPATADLLVNPGQPPSVSKSFAPASIVAGQKSTLTIALGNGNAGAATLTADLVDSLPAGVTVATPPAIAGTCPSVATNVTAVAGGTSVAYKSGATIPPGGCSIQVAVTSSTLGTVTNTIATGALQTDLGNNTVGTSANLTVTSSDPGAVASVAGTVYHDRNDNGAIDGGGEEGIAGVEIRLMQAGAVVATTTTDAGGHYSFTNLAPGTYTVAEIQPAGWDDGKDTAGSKGGTTGNDIISNIVLVGGDAATDYNFGEHRPATPTAIPTLSQYSLMLLALLMMAWVYRQHRAAAAKR